MTAMYAAAERPDELSIAKAGAALPLVRDYLATHLDNVVEIAVIDEQEERLELPREALELLSRILAHMAAGEGVSLVPLHAELTTQQAADLMNVSRPFLIGLLDAGEIQYRTVGKHRRILAQSLMAYIAADDRKRREAAAELTQLNQEMGLL